LKRARMVAALAGTPRINTVVPQAGMFMLVDVRGTGLSGYEFMRALYRSERVSVLDGAAFGRETAGFVRVCFATDDHSLEEGCRRIRRFCEQL
ncbi:aminotransferase class I/II-fold pyridoxal phosphate-dependent enzyme, partial [Enterococcus faecium]|uniref:aminotransferase class I/II-fold pyridoxal phosphate-dependent enzyme n=1 Tax=Enterococcus faecium TaxID=1352 RepID=UPI003F438A6D